MPERGLTHIDPLGRARMVDVTPKEATHRRAVARCRVHMQPETTSKVASNAITKGDVLAVSRVAGIQAAKQAANLIPLCHPLLVGAVTINFTIGDDYVEVESQVETVDRTGVEMEALTSCAVAALTIYDMCKSFDRAMVIGDLALWEKTGGRSGHWRRGVADSFYPVPADPGLSEPGRALPIEEEIDDLIGEDHDLIGEDHDLIGEDHDLIGEDHDLLSTDHSEFDG